MVNTLTKNIERVINDYIRLYNRGLNIEKPLIMHMETFISESGYSLGDSEYSDEYNRYREKLISDNTGKSERVSNGTNSITFLVKCMYEYKSLGAYGMDSDDELTDFYDIITNFISDYSTDHKSILIEDFLEYIREFLSGSLYDNVPELGSVHSMKGGEADVIYIYDYPLFPYKIGKNLTKDDEQQELNLQYVAITRAKHKLRLILCDADGDKRLEEKNNECRRKLKEIFEKIK